MSRLTMALTHSMSACLVSFVRLQVTHTAFNECGQKEAIIVAHNKKARSLSYPDIDGRSLKLNHIGAH